MANSLNTLYLQIAIQSLGSDQATVITPTPVPLDTSPSVCPSETCAALGHLAANPASPDLQCTVNEDCDTITCEGYLLAIIPDLPLDLEETRYASVTKLFFCNETTNVLITISEPSSGNELHILSPLDICRAPAGALQISLKDILCMTLVL